MYGGMNRAMSKATERPKEIEFTSDARVSSCSKLNAGLMLHGINISIHALDIRVRDLFVPVNSHFTPFHSSDFSQIIFRVL